MKILLKFVYSEYIIVLNLYLQHNSFYPNIRAVVAIFF